MFDRLLCILVALAVAVTAVPVAAQTSDSKSKQAKRKKAKAPAKSKKKPKKIVLTGACADYHKERVALEAAGVRDQLKQDAAVVAATMSPEELGRIRRLITLDEKLMFECRVIKRQVAINKPKPVQTVAAGIVPDLPTRRPKRSPSSSRTDDPTVPLPIRPVR